MKKQGAKGKYEPWLQKDGLLLLEAWARDGLTDVQIAGKVGIGKTTLWGWKEKFPEIRDALKKNKEMADIEVENSLFKRAIGYEYEEIHERYEFGSLVEKRVIKKHMPPDVTAQIIWLKNRKRDAWRDKWDIEAAVKTNSAAGLTTEELKKLVRDNPL